MQSDFKLPALARHLFGFVNTHASLIEEMQEVMDAYRYMEHLCKEKGLSRTTAAECISHIGKTLMPGGERPRRLGGSLSDISARRLLCWKKKMPFTTFRPM